MSDLLLKGSSENPTPPKEEAKGSEATDYMKKKEKKKNVSTLLNIYCFMKATS